MRTIHRRLRLSPGANTFSQRAEQRLLVRLSQTTWQLRHSKEKTTRCLSTGAVRLLKASHSLKAQDSVVPSDGSSTMATQIPRQTPTTILQQNDASRTSQAATKPVEYGHAQSAAYHADESFILNNIVSPELDHPQQLADLDLDKLDSWLHIFYLRPNGLAMLDGIWESFQQMLQKQRVHLLMEPEADSLRDDILMAALSSRERVMCLMQTLEGLRKEHNFEWPGLYLKAMNKLLERQDHKLATQVHFLLYRVMPPGKAAIGNLFSTFVTDPSPSIQSLLTQLYMLSTDRNFYDHVIPSLFFAGQSMAARNWRKHLIAFQDFPSKSNMNSRPFLRFMSLYFPTIELTPQELDILRDSPRPSEAENSDSKPQPSPDLPESFLSDATVARWFASRWTSIEFAINIIGRSGVRKIGPLALQSLALREDDATGVRTRMAQLQKLDVQVAENVYSKMVIACARNGDQKNLDTLLQCDVQPDEFEKPRVREMLLASARKKSDKNMQELLEAIEYTLRLGQLGKLRSRSANEHSVDSSLDAKQLETDSMKQSTEYQDALELAESFRGLKRFLHPKFGQAGKQRQKQIADGAIDTTRRLVDKEVTIPLFYWRTLLYHLGRNERFSEFEHLCLEIVDLYRSRHSGIMEVHPHDVPGAREDSECDSATAEPTERRTYEEFASIFFSVSETSNPNKPTRRLYVPTSLDKESAWIPADLPFGHHKHPVYALFSRRLQQAIVKWGFSYAMRKSPAPEPPGRGSHTLDIYDVAWGVRILALLRDEGVLIDQMTLKANVYKRTSALQSPASGKDRSRDSNETSPVVIKRLVDDAWGSELLPPLPEFQKEVEREMRKATKRNPRLSEDVSGNETHAAFSDDDDFIEMSSWSQTEAEKLS